MTTIRPIHLFAAACIVGVLAGSGMAIGQFASRDTLTACVSSDGAMRLSRRGTCPSGQRAVRWSVRGPTGPAGPAGPVGPVGPAGPVSTINNVNLDALPFMQKSRFAGAGTLATNFTTTSTTGECILGEIRLFGGNFAPQGWAFAAGQTVPISSNQALFSLYGTTYGGNGRTNFELPDLTDMRPDGASYIVCMSGIYPSRT